MNRSGVFSLPTRVANMMGLSGGKEAFAGVAGARAGVDGAGPRTRSTPAAPRPRPPSTMPPEDVRRRPSKDDAAIFFKRQRQEYFQERMRENGYEVGAHFFDKPPREEPHTAAGQKPRLGPDVGRHSSWRVQECEDSDVTDPDELRRGLDSVLTPEALVRELRRLRHLAGPSDRRQIFREQRLRWHPDKNPGHEEFARGMFQALEGTKKWFLSDC